MARFIPAALLFLLALSPAHAVDVENRISKQVSGRTMELSVNPMGGLFLGRISGAYKFKVSGHIALIIPLTAGIRSPVLGFGSTSHTTWSIYSGFGARLYLTDHAFEPGWFVDTVLQVGYSHLTDSLSPIAFNPYMLVGYGWVFDTGITVNMGLGVQYNFHSHDSTWPHIYFIFPLPVLEASLGYSW